MMKMIKVTLNDLAALPKPKVLGPRHYPLPHYQFARAIEDTLEDHGIEVSDRNMEISHGGTRIFGTYNLKAPTTVRAAGEAIPGALEPMIGFKNSLDQLFRGRVAMAGRVFNCSNGMWFMEEGFEIKRKNTTRIREDLCGMMEGMVRDYWAKFMAVVDTQADLARDRLHDREAHHLICQATRDGVTAHSHAGRVLDAWHDSPFDWGEKSLWRLHNCHTYVLDREVDNPYVRSQRNLKLNDLIGRHRQNTMAVTNN